MKLQFIGLAICVATTLSSCTNGDRGISTAIARQFQVKPPGSVDLALVGPSTWTRVCVLRPYTTNELAEKQIGFKWNVEQHSRIGSDDSINLLVFIREAEVVATEHPRSEGDFLKLSPLCLQRTNAKLIRDTKEGELNQLVAN